MKKRIQLFMFICLLAIVGISLTNQAWANQSNDQKNATPLQLVVLGKWHNFAFGQPYIVNGRTLVPLRDLLNALGIPNDDQAIQYDAQTKTVTAIKGETTLQLTVSDPIIYVNGHQHTTMDVAAQLKEGRVYLPARAVAEAFGYRVFYNSHVNTIVINAPERESQEELNSRLLDAAKDVNYPLVLSLLADGADPNVKDDPNYSHANTPAMLVSVRASQERDIEDSLREERVRILEILHTYGADLNMTDKHYNTLLSDIIYSDTDGNQEVLLRKAIQLGAIDGVHAVLRLSQTENRVNVLQWMVEEGWDINGRYTTNPEILNKTLLENAIERQEHHTIILQLLELGANPKLDDSISIAEQGLQTARLTEAIEDQTYYEHVLDMLINARDGKQTKTEQPLVAAPQVDEFFNEKKNRFLINQDDKFGYIDKHGNIVIEPQFESADEFSEGLAAVESDDGLKGYIDETGNYVVEPTYLYGFPFHEGLAPVFNMATWESEIQFINRNGEVVLTTNHAMTTGFNDGLALVVKKNRDGYYDPVEFIDPTGQVVLSTPYPFSWASPITFNEGFANVNHNGVYIFIDHTGEQAFDSTFVDAYPFLNGAAAVGVEGNYGITQYGYINTDGDFIIEPSYYGAQYFTEGLAPVQNILGKWGFIDKQGGLVIPMQYEDALPFTEGLAAVRSGDKWGFINKQGQWEIEPEYDGVEYFDGGLAKIYEYSPEEGVNRFAGYINHQGEIVWSSSDKGEATQSY